MINESDDGPPSTYIYLSSLMWHQLSLDHSRDRVIAACQMDNKSCLVSDKARDTNFG